MPMKGTARGSPAGMPACLSPVLQVLMTPRDSTRGCRYMCMQSRMMLGWRPLCANTLSMMTSGMRS
eukprot:5138930-Amphidinium_carterae.1